MSILTYRYRNVEQKECTILVELANTEFVNEWKDYLYRISEKVPNLKWYGSGLNNSRLIRTVTKEDNIPCLQQLFKNFSFFTENNIEDRSDMLRLIEQLLVFPETVRQEHLNVFHRHFTRLENKFLSRHSKPPDHVKHRDLWQNIQDLNGYTHKMEGWTYPLLERRNPYLGVMQYSFQFTNAHNLAGVQANVFGVGNIEWIDEKFDFDFFKESFNYDVWLHEDITGKDQMKAWLDHDDLTQVDITGNLLMTPNITFDPYMIYYRVLTNEEFRKESISCGKKLNRYPLGRIINTRDIYFQDIVGSEITSIALDNRILWSSNASL